MISERWTRTGSKEWVGERWERERERRNKTGSTCASCAVGTLRIFTIVHPKKEEDDWWKKRKTSLVSPSLFFWVWIFLIPQEVGGGKKGLVSVGETWKMMISTVTRRLEKTTEEKKKDEERGAYVDAIRLSSRKRWKEEMRRENRSNDLKSLRGVITIYTTIQIANDKRGRKSVVFLIHISIERKRESVCVGQYMALGTKWFSRSTSSSLEKTPRKKK